MDPRQLALLDATQSSYLRLTAKAREQLARTVAARFEALGSWREADAAKFENAVVPIVLASERQMADLTSAYLARMDETATGSAHRVDALNMADVTGEATRGGVAPSEVYRRPFAQVGLALSRGASMTSAVTQGRDRAVSLASTDLQLTKTHTVAKQGRHKWFRRTLTGQENCALCVIASTQRYHRGNLMPIHPGCDCGVQEEHTLKPGQVIDPDLLEEVHTAVIEETGSTDRGARYIDGRKAIDLRGGSTRAADYTDLIVTRQHGEYGPTLSWRDQHFTGPNDLED